MERSTKHEAKLILTWLISAAMIGLYRVCTLVVRVYLSNRKKIGMDQVFVV
jgi:hypothetical protein